MKFNNFEISEPCENVYHFKFKSHFKLCLSFFKLQEYYESPIKSVRGKNFTLMEAMEKYSKKYGAGSFTYANDWSGFNIPDWVFIESWNAGFCYDQNELDKAMNEAYAKCEKMSDGKPFYIIGSSGNNTTMKHEVAHGLYYTNQSFRGEMDNLIESVDQESRNAFFKALKDMRYCKEVFKDEMQSYLSTGLMEEFRGIVSDSKRRKFVAVFKKYYK